MEPGRESNGGGEEQTEKEREAGQMSQPGLIGINFSTGAHSLLALLFFYFCVWGYLHVLEKAWSSESLRPMAKPLHSLRVDDETQVRFTRSTPVKMLMIDVHLSYPKQFGRERWYDSLNDYPVQCHNSAICAASDVRPKPTYLKVLRSFHSPPSLAG